MEDTEKIREHVTEALKLSGKERYLGRVTKIDLAKTTAFVDSGGVIFLAFVRPLNLKIGQCITFSTAGQRAVNIILEEV